MWAGCPAGGTDEADHFALIDPLAFGKTPGETVQMCVCSTVAAAVAQDHDVAVTVLTADEIDRAIGGRLDRGAGRCPEIHTIVCPPALVDRMQASPETGRDP